MDGSKVSVSVSISGGAQQRHLGFEVSDAEGVSVYHLASHCFFLKSTPDEYRRASPDYMRVELVNFTPHEMMHICSHLKVIYARNGKSIPYGFHFVADSVLTRDGVVPSDLPSGAGLTCATFVLQVLRNQDFHILDMDSWRGRDDDAEWQKSILEMLRPYISQEHFDGLEKVVGVAVRFRPEEVAGCAREFEDEPIKFPAGVILGHRVCQEMVQKGYMAG